MGSSRENRMVDNVELTTYKDNGKGARRNGVIISTRVHPTSTPYIFSQVVCLLMKEVHH